MYDFKTLHESRQTTDVVSIDDDTPAPGTLEILLTNDKQSQVDRDTTL